MNTIFEIGEIIVLILLTLIVLYLTLVGPYLILKIIISNYIKSYKAKKNKKLFLNKYNNWLIKCEPLYRNDFSKNGYPEDWPYRRFYIYLKFNGICARCKCRIKISNLIFNEKDFYIRGAHIHHKVYISNSGTHSLENLEFLCSNCHEREHGRSFSDKQEWINCFK